MQTRPKVSVLIPTYNYARYLDEAIESVLQQSYTDYELIIVDDHSADNTDDILQKYSGYPQIRYYKNEKNLGLVQNFNKCLEYANGKYIKYLLADDKLHPDLLERYVEIMERYPSVSLVTCGSETFGDYSTLRIPPLLGYQKGSQVIMECLKNGKGNWIGEPTVVMFRRSSLEIGRFNTNYVCLVDLDMWLRVLQVGDCYIIPDALAFFRVHQKQASAKTQIRNWYDEYYFYRDVKMNNTYNVDLSQLDIDIVVRRKAKKCVKRISTLIPGFYKDGNLSLIVEGLKIGRAEKIL
jgi:glycosyltransferase involved in cell wall biosynthesis